MKQILDLIFTACNSYLKSLAFLQDRLSIAIAEKRLDGLFISKLIYRASLLLTLVATPTLLILVFFSPSISLAIDLPTPSPAPEDDSIIRDITPPVITILGDNPLYLELGELNYNGAIAWDNVDGNVTADIITLAFCNENIPSTCTETYKVEDKAGNLAITYRLVIYGDGGATATPVAYPDPIIEPTNTATPFPPYPAALDNPSSIELVDFWAKKSKIGFIEAIIIALLVWLILVGLIKAYQILSKK